MSDLYYNFYYPWYERMDFPTNNPIAKLGSLCLEPGRVVFWKKVEVLDKDNILSVRTIEKPIKHSIVTVALRIILWIPTSFGILCLELVRATSTQFETKMWEARKACVMNILNHDKWESLEEREITASNIRGLLPHNKIVTLADDLFNKYDEENQDERVGSQVAFMRYEVSDKRNGPNYWYSPSVQFELEKLRFASMSDEAASKYAPLSRFPYIKVLFKLPQHCHQAILDQLEIDKKIEYLLCDDFIDFIPRDSCEFCESLVKIVSEQFANYIITHLSLATVIDKFKESIYPSIDLSWVFAEEHDSLLKNLLKHIGDDEKNKRWLFNLAESAFNHNNGLKFFSLLSGKQIILIYLVFGKNFEEIIRIKMTTFNLILRYKEIRSKFTPSDFERIYHEMSWIYKHHCFPDRLLDKDMKGDEYKFLFSPCGEDIESLCNIPCSLLKIYLDAAKNFYSYRLLVLVREETGGLVLWNLTMIESRNIFQLHSISPELQEKIQSSTSKIQEIIQNQRNEYLKHFHTILYLDDLVFLKIYHGILTKEEKAYILELSREEPEKGSVHLPHSLQIVCMKFLHENPESMEQEKCNDGMLASINTYKSLYL